MNFYEAIAVPNHSSAHPNNFALPGPILFRQLHLTETNLRPQITFIGERDVSAIDLQRLQFHIHRVKLIGGFCRLFHHAGDFTVVAQIAPANEAHALEWSEEEAGSAGKPANFAIHALPQVFCNIFGAADFWDLTAHPLMVGNRGAGATCGQRSNDYQARHRWH